MFSSVLHMDLVMMFQVNIFGIVIGLSIIIPIFVFYIFLGGIVRSRLKTDHKFNSLDILL